MDKADNDTCADALVIAEVPWSIDHKTNSASDDYSVLGESCPGVGIDAGLAGPAFAQPVAPVIQEQDIRVQADERRRVGKAMGSVARVAVEKEQYAIGPLGG